MRMRGGSGGEGIVVGLASNVRPGVDMGSAAEIPDHGGAFELPDVPDAVVSDIAPAVEGHVKVLETVFVDVFHGFLPFRFAEGSEEIIEDTFDEVLLIGGHFGDGNAIEAFLLAGQFNGLVSPLGASPLEEGVFALFAVEGFEDFVCPEGLIPVGVVRVIFCFVEAIGGVAVEDGATKGGAFDGIAVAAAGAMATGEDELEFPGAGFTEDGDG